MATRKPMTFSMDKPKPPSAAATKPDEEQRRSVGARVTVGVYRRLKSHAALAGLKVQDLVEEAIRAKLEQLDKATQ